MAFTLQQVVQGARDRHPAFHQSRVPHVVVARWCSDYCNALIQKAAQRETRYMQQAASIVLALSDANTPGTAGAGTSGGLPGRVNAAGDAVEVVQDTTGSLVELGLSADDGATVMVSERVVTSATATTLTATGAGRTTNEDAGRILVITSGTGQGQRLEVLSNTDDTWAFADAWTDLPSGVIPDATSLFEVVAATYELTEGVGVVTALPSVEATTGYLVKVDASGSPYLDYTAPLVSSITSGVGLPSFHAVTGGTLHYTDGGTDPLPIVSYRQRLHASAPAVYVVGEELFLCGDAEDWREVASLELHYIPVAPDLTRLTDTVLLPDAAKGCVVAQAAAMMALRVAGMADVTIDAAAYAAVGMAAEQQYLTSLALGLRGRTQVMRGMD